MIIRVKYTKAIDHDGEMELWINNEDLFAMLNCVKPRVLAEYLGTRMKPEEHPEQLLVNILGEEGGER